MIFTFQPLYLLLIVPAFLGWFAQWRLRQIYYRYLKVPNKKGIRGGEVAKVLLSSYNLNLPVLQTKRQMINYYNPQNKTLNFCTNIIELASITSLGIVAHEVEHAVQDKQGFRFMNLRNKLAKSLAIMGQLSPLIFIWGIFFRNIFLVYLGIILLFGMAVFALVSLPVELNASNRALTKLQEIGLSDQQEIKMVAMVLRYAALTYFVEATQRIGTFLFILLLFLMFRKS
ncbi:MAG: zinc metallopeptidase [Candidatus Atribacteria bacterium]|nr:zinc metallopeptidase [Candidatus Atribacteria bacterium]